LQIFSFNQVAHSLAEFNLLPVYETGSAPYRTLTGLGENQVMVYDSSMNYHVFQIERNATSGGLTAIRLRNGNIQLGECNNLLMGSKWIIILIVLEFTILYCFQSLLIKAKIVSSPTRLHVSLRMDVVGVPRLYPVIRLTLSTTNSVTIMLVKPQFLMLLLRVS
jgi:hypothetical protein